MSDKKQLAIGFAIWLGDNGYFIDNEKGLWISYQNDPKEYTDSQIYNEYIKSLPTPPNK